MTAPELIKMLEKLPPGNEIRVSETGKRHYEILGLLKGPNDLVIILGAGVNIELGEPS